VEPLLLECNLGGAWWWYPEGDTAPGMPTGAGSIRADRRGLWEVGKPVLLLGRLVDSRLGLEPESVFITHCLKTHAPNPSTRRV
jgi:hypothetical protein